MTLKRLLGALFILLLMVGQNTAFAGGDNPNDPAWWETKGPHAAECVKFEYPNAPDWAYYVEDGRGVVLSDTLHWEWIIVKGGAVPTYSHEVDRVIKGSNTVLHPVGQHPYFPPLNAGGNMPVISHFIVCIVDIIPTTTTTEVPPSTTTTTPSTTTVPPSTTSTTVAPTTTLVTTSTSTVPPVSTTTVPVSTSTSLPPTTTTPSSTQPTTTIKVAVTTPPVPPTTTVDPETVDLPETGSAALWMALVASILVGSGLLARRTARGESSQA